MNHATSPRTGVRRALTGLVAGVTALVAVSFVATPAWAHAKLLRTTPATDGTATEPFTAVTLTFNEPVKQQSTSVVVSGSDGVSYTEGGARVVDTDVIQAVRPLPAGPVRVTWKTVSADGDAINGEFGFTVAPSAAPTTAPPTTAPPTTAAPEAALTATAQSEPEPEKASTSTPWVPIGVGVVVLAALAVAGMFWRRRRTDTG